MLLSLQTFCKFSIIPLFIGLCQTLVVVLVLLIHLLPSFTNLHLQIIHRDLRVPLPQYLPGILRVVNIGTQRLLRHIRISPVFLIIMTVQTIKCGIMVFLLLLRFRVGKPSLSLTTIL